MDRQLFASVPRLANFGSGVAAARTAAVKQRNWHSPFVTMRASLNELVSSTRSLAVGDESSVPNVTSCQDSTRDSKDESPPSEAERPFVNAGLQRWEEIRRRWLSSSRSSPPSMSPSDPSRASKAKRHAADIDVDEVIDLVVSNRWRQQAPPAQQASSTSSLDDESATRDDARFPNPVSLPQMVDVLVDLWEAEGLDI